MGNTFSFLDAPPLEGPAYQLCKDSKYINAGQYHRTLGAVLKPYEG
jgi:hypothetical protein